MKDKELREIVYDLVKLLDDTGKLYDKDHLRNQQDIVYRAQQLKKCRCSF